MEAEKKNLEDNLKNAMDAYNKTTEQLENVHKEAKAEIQKAGSEIERRDQIIHQNNSNLQAKNAEMISAEDTIRKAQFRIRELETEIVQAKEEFVKSNNGNQQKSQEIQVATETIQRAQMRINTLETEINKMHNEWRQHESLLTSSVLGQHFFLQIEKIQ